MDQLAKRAGAAVVHAYALLSLPFSVSAALFRSLTGVSGKGMDELFASQFAPGGAGESDTALLRGLREKHKLAMAALHDQLDEQAERMAKQRGLSKEEFMDIEKKRLAEHVDTLAKDRKVRPHARGARA